VRDVTIKSRNKAIFWGVVLTAAAVVVSFLPMLASSDLDKAREIRLVARDMTFYLEGSTEPNPTLAFRAGEKVRLILKNEDAGIDHNFSIPTWDASTKLLEGRGEDAIEFKVPKRKGSEKYTCTPHSEMMRGTIRIE
jgi:plastocyanin